VRLLKSICIAFSTYSILPTPHFEWSEENLRYSICFLPLVGLLIGAILFLWDWLCRLLAVDSVLFAAVATVLSLLLTGGIHMDGFMDTVDALASHQEREKKLAILKDPHVGAFAVIYLSVYLLLSFGLYHTLFQWNLALVVCLGFVLSRALTVVTAFTLPHARREGMLHTLAAPAQTRLATIVLALVALLTAGAMVFIGGIPGICAVVFALVALICYCVMALRQFGGATGDTCGFFLQLCELMILLGVWVGSLF